MQAKPPAKQAEAARPLQQAASAQSSSDQSTTVESTAAPSGSSPTPGDEATADKRDEVKARHDKQAKTAPQEEVDASQADPSIMLLAMIGERQHRAIAAGDEDVQDSGHDTALRLAHGVAKDSALIKPSATADDMHVDADDLASLLGGAATATKGMASSSGESGTSPFATVLDAQQTPIAGPSASTPTASPAVDIPARLGTPQWDQAIGQRMIWMAAGAQQTASLTLNPPELGPLQVVLSLNNTQASATFIAAQPEVRQALEAAMPRLREMLGDAGIQLGQASVNAGNPEQQQRFAQQNSGSGQHHGRDEAGSSNDPATVVAEPVSRPISGRGMVDTFA